MIENGTLLQERYLIEKKIGAGGMGAVYLAVDQRFENHVAIKETFYHEPELSDAFFREARLLNALQHPVLPHVSDYFAENNGYFLVMQFIEGEDLLDTLKREGAFAVEDVLRWTDQLLDALEYLHSQEPPIIHRDIKPHNLKGTMRGDIRLLDFGLAKIHQENTAGAISVFGFSRTYSPLEQIQGTGTDARSDLFALGATAYHLATGKAPVDAITRASSIVAGRPDPLVPIVELNPQFPEDAAEVLQMALSLNGDNRFVSAKAMRQALEHARNPDLREKIEAAAAAGEAAPPPVDKRSKRGSRIAASPEFAAFASKRVEDATPADPEFIGRGEFPPEIAERGKPAPRREAANLRDETPRVIEPAPVVPLEALGAVETPAVVAREPDMPQPAEPSREIAIEPEPEAESRNVAAPAIVPTPTIGAPEVRETPEPPAFAPRATAAADGPSNGSSFGGDEREESDARTPSGRTASFAAALWLLPVLLVFGAMIYLFRGAGASEAGRAAETAPSVAVPKAAPPAETTANVSNAAAPIESNAATGRQSAETKPPTPARQRAPRAEEPAPVNRETAAAENAPAAPVRKQSPPPGRRARNRERVLETETVPDIESVFTGRPSTDRRQTPRNDDDDWIRDEMTEEELRELRRQRRERRRQRRNNDPLLF